MPTISSEPILQRFRKATGLEEREVNESQSRGVAWEISMVAGSGGERQRHGRGPRAAAHEPKIVPHRFGVVGAVQQDSFPRGDGVCGTIMLAEMVRDPARSASFEVALFRASQSWNPCARWLFRARAPALNCARVSPFDDEHEHHPPRRIEHEQDKKPKSATSKGASCAGVGTAVRGGMGWGLETAGQRDF